MKDKSMTGRYGRQDTTLSVREQYLHQCAQAGTLTVDDVRRVRGLAPLGGDAGKRKVTASELPKLTAPIGG